MAKESGRSTQNASATARGAGSRVLIIADDYQFLDTLHAHAEALTYQYEVAATRERVVQLAQPHPLAILVDLQMQSLDPVETLRLLDVLGVHSRIVLLSSSDLSVVSRAVRFMNSASLSHAGILSRPASINGLLRLLDREAAGSLVVTAEDLAGAIEHHQFVLHYQPIVERDGERWIVRSVEALLRWQHPQRGLIFPGQFLGIAADSNLTGPLTDWVMTEAVRQANEWQRMQLDLAVAVNLAPSLVQDMGFVDRLMRLLKEFDLEPHKLVLEVVEAASPRDRELVRDAMMRLRLQGVGLSLDDFGTGRSSLTELCALPYSELKIDRSLTNGLPTHREAATIVDAVITLAHRLSIRVCAEGIENAEAFDFLCDIGCDALQGLYISKPVPAQEVSALLVPSQIWEPPGTA